MGIRHKKAAATEGKKTRLTAKTPSRGNVTERRLTGSNSTQELEETAPERWVYVVYRDGKRVELTKEEYEARYHPGSEDQL